jgi:hypothetical protein
MELLIQEHSLAFELARRLHEWGTIAAIVPTARSGANRSDPARSAAPDPARSGAIPSDIRDPPRSGATPGDLHAIPSDPPRSDATPAVRSEAAPVIMVYAKIEVSDRLPPARAKTLSR